MTVSIKTIPAITPSLGIPIRLNTRRYRLLKNNKNQRSQCRNLCSRIVNLPAYVDDFWIRSSHDVILTVAHRLLSLRCTLRRAVMLLRRCSTICHGLDVWTVLQRLVEVADSACDIGVTGDRQGNQRLQLLLADCEDRMGGRSHTIQQNVNQGLLFWT